jgi:hypothetical protein
MQETDVPGTGPITHLWLVFSEMALNIAIQHEVEYITSQHRMTGVERTRCYENADDTRVDDGADNLRPAIRGRVRAKGR